jgi:hypothetical protein
MTNGHAAAPDANLAFMREAIGGGEHWYTALLKTIARWPLPEEEVEGRHFRYLIGGEAFDWLVLAERIVEALADLIPAEERENLLFNANPPIEIEESEFERLIGTPKYQAYLNYLYGVTVEEALQLAIEDEIAKEHHSHIWASSDDDRSSPHGRIYGKSEAELLGLFRKDRGLKAGPWLELTEHKEFTYWLFKYRIKVLDGARVASDTRKGLATLSRVEASRRTRQSVDWLEIEVGEVDAVFDRVRSRV